MTPPAKPAARSAKKATPDPRVLYLYAISAIPERAAPVIRSEGIDGDAVVEAVRSGKYLAWVSRVSKPEFADPLSERMQDLEWLATAGLRHQRVVAEISSHIAAVPTRFGTVFLTEESLAKHIEERKQALQKVFRRVAEADEWGIKIFAAPRAQAAPETKAASGSEYLKRKADLLQPRSSKVDEDVSEFLATLNEIAVASAPGGKASAGQPGLVWHGSFLIRRKDRKKLEAALKKYASRWQNARRIDCSGPWPPYSFVGDDVH